MVRLPLALEEAGGGDVGAKDVDDALDDDDAEDALVASTFRSFVMLPDPMKPLRTEDTWCWRHRARSGRR